jgi:DNA replication protein DnaC
MTLDKAKVEVGVQVVERWILAALRQRRFSSLGELNQATAELLERLNQRPFRKRSGSRLSLFEALERPALRSLPAERYELAEWKTARVNIDYHIEIERHYYSVPHPLVGQRVEARLTAGAIEIFHRGRRVASHPRSREPYRQSTLDAHRPKSHQRHLEWTPSRLIDWARTVGPATAQVFETDSRLQAASGDGLPLLPGRLAAEQALLCRARGSGLAPRAALRRLLLSKPQVDAGARARPASLGRLAARAPAHRARQHPRRRVLRSAATYRNTRSGKPAGGLMLTEQTLDKLYAMKLNGMAEAFRQQQEDPAVSSLSFEERFGLLVDQQWSWKEDRALSRRLAQARFKLAAAVEDIDYRHARGLDRKLVRSLAADSRWVRQHHNVFLLGPAGIGKSYLACALAQKACRDGFTALYTRAPQLFRELAVAHADGSLPRRLLRLARIDVLIVDDWAMAPLNEVERRDFLEVCDDRYQRRSTILTSQLPVAKWHAQIGDPTIADSILDRLVHEAHRIELQGESMRKKHAGKTASDEEAQA